jgi:hypothetical protein
LSGELTAMIQLSRLPNMSVFDSSSRSASFALRAAIDSRTTVGGGVGYETTSYPDYDLDHRGFSLSTSLDRQLGRHTHGTLSLTWRRRYYSERLVRVAQDPAEPTQTADESRTESVRLIAARLARSLTSATRLELGYEYGGVGSNGDLVGGDSGSVADDERFVGDFYAHRRHEVSARLRWLIRRGASLTVAARYVGRAYRDWLARDADERPLSPEEKRSDRGVQLSATWDLPVPRLPRSMRFGHFGLRLRLVREASHSNDAIYDYSHDSFMLALTSWR